MRPDLVGGLGRKYARGVDRVIADEFSIAISLDLVGSNATREAPVRELPQADLGQGQDTRRSYTYPKRAITIAQGQAQGCSSTHRTTVEFCFTRANPFPCLWKRPHRNYRLREMH
jgi:hypothetical protein